MREQDHWKLQAENGVDGYHVSTVHRVFATTVAAREKKNKLEGMQETEAGRMTGRMLAMFTAMLVEPAPPLAPATQIVMADRKSVV